MYIQYAAGRSWGLWHKKMSVEVRFSACSYEKLGLEPCSYYAKITPRAEGEGKKLAVSRFEEGPFLGHLQTLLPPTDALFFVHLHAYQPAFYSLQEATDASKPSPDTPWGCRLLGSRRCSLSDMRFADGLPPGVEPPPGLRKGVPLYCLQVDLPSLDILGPATLILVLARQQDHQALPHTPPAATLLQQEEGVLWATAGQLDVLRKKVSRPLTIGLRELEQNLYSLTQSQNQIFFSPSVFSFWNSYSRSINTSYKSSEIYEKITGDIFHTATFRYFMQAASRGPTDPSSPAAEACAGSFHWKHLAAWTLRLLLPISTRELVSTPQLWHWLDTVSEARLSWENVALVKQQLQAVSRFKSLSSSQQPARGPDSVLLSTLNFWCEVLTKIVVFVPSIQKYSADVFSRRISAKKLAPRVVHAQKSRWVEEEQWIPSLHGARFEDAVDDCESLTLTAWHSWIQLREFAKRFVPLTEARLEETLSARTDPERRHPTAGVSVADKYLYLLCLLVLYGYHFSITLGPLDIELSDEEEDDDDEENDGGAPTRWKRSRSAENYLEMKDHGLNHGIERSNKSRGTLNVESMERTSYESDGKHIAHVYGLLIPQCIFQDLRRVYAAPTWWSELEQRWAREPPSPPPNHALRLPLLLLECTSSFRPGIRVWKKKELARSKPGDLRRGVAVPPYAGQIYRCASCVQTVRNQLHSCPDSCLSKQETSLKITCLCDQGNVGFDGYRQCLTVNIPELVDEGFVFDSRGSSGDEEQRRLQRLAMSRTMALVGSYPCALHLKSRKWNTGTLHELHQKVKNSNNFSRSDSAGLYEQKIGVALQDLGSFFSYQQEESRFRGCIQTSETDAILRLYDTTCTQYQKYMAPPEFVPLITPQDAHKYLFQTFNDLEDGTDYFFNPALGVDKNLTLGDMLRSIDKENARNTDLLHPLLLSHKGAVIYQEGLAT